MSETIPTAALLDRLEEAIDGRKVLAALFTTFEFQPGFFEEHVLPVLFDQSFSNIPRLRRVQLEEAVTAGPPVAVYYDARHSRLDREEAIGPGLDFRKIPVVRKGFFHPKVFLVLVERAGAEGADPEQSLIVAVGSANLTRRGWWENVEAVWMDEIEAGAKIRYKDDLKEFLAQVRKEGYLAANHEALERILSFLRREVEAFQLRSWVGVFEPRLFYGQSGYEGFADFLASETRLPAATYNLEILSPYFEGSGAGPLADLIDRLQPRSVRLLEPQPEERGADAKEPFLQAVRELGRAVRWGHLPDEHLRWGRSGSQGGTHRFVHAKVYRLWSQSEGREILAVGSINLTSAAHGRVTAGNLEAAIVFEVPGKSSTRLQFWLNESEKEPAALHAAAEALEEEPVTKVALRYHWQRRLAESCWIGTANELASFEVLGPTPEPLGRCDRPVVGEWELLEVDVERIEECLKGSPVLRVRLGEEEMRVLVAEEGVAYRPSFVLSLTPEEILRYWSLLTPEQREGVLASKLGRELEGHEQAVAAVRSASRQESVFDRFAGIFHAFARLEEHVKEALAEGRAREAEARLFGARYDSLPALIEKVLAAPADEEEPDGEQATGHLVHRYVTLLTAKQLVTKLRESSGRQVSGFVESHLSELDALETRLSRLEEIETRLDLGTENERKQFLAWFRPRFLTVARSGEKP